MKYLILSTFLFFVSASSDAQVIDYSAVEQVIDPVEFDGEFIFNNWRGKPEIQKGLVGEIISDLENNKYTIIEYIPSSSVDQASSFQIKNNETGSISNFTYTESLKYYFVKGLERAKCLITEISFTPYLGEQNSKTILGYNGNQIVLSPEQSITISDINIGLFGEDKTPHYAIKLNNTVIVQVLDRPLNYKKTDLMKKLLLEKDILLKIKGNDDSPLSLISIYSDERNNAIEKRRPELAKKGIRPETKGLTDARQIAGMKKAEKAENRKEAARKHAINKSNAEDVDFEKISKLNRDVLKQVYPKDLNKSGKAVFNICINREGNVVYLKYNRSKSTLSDRPSVSDAMTAMKKTTFEPDMSAPRNECGQWTIEFTASDK